MEMRKLGSTGIKVSAVGFGAWQLGNNKDFAGMPLEEFQTLNPQMNKPVILAAGTPQVLLPYDNANMFLRQLEMHRGALASWTAWTAPKTLTPADAARLIGMPEAQLREIPSSNLQLLA